MGQRIHRIISSLIGATLTFAAMTARPARADDLPSSLSIRGITYAGSGCPAGTIEGDVASDLSGVKLYFDEFVAETGPGVPFSEGRKNCQIVLDLNLPQGWSYAIANVSYRGYVDLDRGVTATQTSTYYFQGSANQASLHTTLNGPVNDDYVIRDTLAVTNQIWSPCSAQRALNINASVRTTGRSYGLITLDSVKARVEHAYGLTFRRCR